MSAIEKGAWIYLCYGEETVSNCPIPLRYGASIKCGLEIPLQIFKLVAKKKEGPFNPQDCFFMDSQERFFRYDGSKHTLSGKQISSPSYYMKTLSLKELFMMIPVTQLITCEKAAVTWESRL